MSNVKKNVPTLTNLQMHKATAIRATTTVTTPIITVNSEPMPDNATGAKAMDTATLPISAPPKKKSLSSMSDEEIIQENLKELLERKSREERKANGRLVAVIVAILVIFLAIYQAWIRNVGALAGVLVPAFIMLSYGAWVVILAKRDKHKRDMFERHIEEVALKSKAELDEEAHLRQTAKYDKATAPSSPIASPAAFYKDYAKQTSLHFENELPSLALVHGKAGNQRKKQRRRLQRQQREHATAKVNDGNVNVHRSALGRRPSIRKKLFGQTMSHVKVLDMQIRSNIVSAATVPTCNSGDGAELLKPASVVALEQKRKRLQRLDTLALPHIVRMRSEP